MDLQRSLTDSENSKTNSRAEAFLLNLAAALHRYGMPSYRLESSLNRVARLLGVTIEIFSIPTGITIGFGPRDSQRVRVLRVEPGAVNLSRVASLSSLIEDLAARTCSLDDAEKRIAALPNEPLPHGELAIALAYSLAAGAAGVLLGAGRDEVIVAAAIGLLIGGLSRAAARFDRIARLFELLSAATAAFLAGVVAQSPMHVSRELTSLAAIIVLLPGYTFTLSLNELAARHLSAGTSRLGGALTTFLLLICGTAVGFACADAVAGHPVPHEVSAPGLSTTIAALLVAPVAFKVLYQARHRDTLLIVAAAFIAYFGGHAGARLLDGQLGAGVGAFFLSLFSNVLARFRRLPAAITLVPGLLVLVPGSLGFRGLSQLLTSKSQDGVEMVAQMLAVGAALVCGLVVANVVLPSRRSL